VIVFVNVLPAFDMVFPAACIDFPALFASVLNFRIDFIVSCDGFVKLSTNCMQVLITLVLTPYPLLSVPEYCLQFCVSILDVLDHVGVRNLLCSIR
jgi:hypothetical protein